MKRRNRGKLWAGILILCAGLMAGCAEKQEETVVLTGSEAAVQESGGTLVLKVNPEIAVEYDENRKVTAVTGRNEDGKQIVESYQDYIGKECHEVVEDLVGLIHEAGYFVEEVEGESRKITIEIETGSILPEEDFVDEIVAGVQTYVKDMQLNSPVVTGEESGDGTTDFDIYEHDYGNEAYEVVVPADSQITDEPAEDSDAGESADAAAPAEENGADTAAPAPDTGNAAQGSGTGNTPASNGNPPAAQESPYTDYETPYEETSPFTDYATPYEEASPYTDYATPYEEASPYTDYATPYEEASPYTDYATPYEEASPYTDYHHESPYEESHYGDSGYSHYH